MANVEPGFATGTIMIGPDGEPMWVPTAEEPTPVDLGPLGIPGIVNAGEQQEQGAPTADISDITMIYLDTDTCGEERKPFTAYYDPDTKVLEIVLPDGWELTEVNPVALLSEITQEHYEMNTGNIGTLNVTPLEQRTCRYFTASAEGKETFNTIDSDFYRFDKNYTAPTCSCPERAGPRRNTLTRCSYKHKMALCSDYEATELRPELNAVTETGDVVVSIRSSKFGPGFIGMKIFSQDQVEPMIIRETPEGDVETYTLDEVADHVQQTHQGIDRIEVVPDDAMPENEETNGGYFGSIALSPVHS